LGTWQGAYSASGGTGGGLSINSVSGSGVTWTITPPLTGTPLGGVPGKLPVANTECRKHRLGALELVGDDVEGVCVGCGTRVIVPSMPETGKTLLRALALEERVMALQDLAETERRRAMANLLPDFAELAALVELGHKDLGAIEVVMRILRSQLASILPAT
jgi:hypothetical protein